jgi:long-chain acyl-CoA synthetase
MPWADLGSESVLAHRGELQRRLGTLRLDDTAQMLYTSGTTGSPKGVPLTHGNVARNAMDWLECNASLLDAEDVDLLWLPMSHIFGFGEMCLGNSLGFTTHMATPQAVLEMLPSVRPTVFMSVPAYWEKLASLARMESDPIEALRRMTGGRLRFCLSGGAGLKEEVKRMFLEMGCLIIEGYGLTECAPTLTLNRPDDYRLDAVGKPLPSVQIRIADDGEILARGPNVFSGYHNDQAATKDAFTDDGWFRTGDLGTLDEDGFLRIIGRKKEIIVTAGGKNVPPANIEMLFQDDPFIEHLVVYGDGKKYLVAGVWPNLSNIREATDDELDDATLRRLIDERVQEANARLARFETIKAFTIMPEPLTVEDELLTASMKIRRKKIYDRFHDRFEELYREKQA